MDHELAEKVFQSVLPTARRVARETGDTLNTGELHREVIEIVVNNPEVTSIKAGRAIVLDALALTGWEGMV